MNLALFINPTKQREPIWTPNVRKFLYEGQRKRKTFDKTMETAFLCVFQKNMASGCWEIVGPARFVRTVRERGPETPPLWELRLLMPRRHTFLCGKTKRDALAYFGFVPKYQNLALGIVPIDLAAAEQRSDNQTLA